MDAPPLRLTSHAAEMIEERAIALEWVRAVLAAPDRTMPDPRGAPLLRAYGTVPQAGGRVLRVVFRREGDVLVVITAHFDRGARP